MTGQMKEVEIKVEGMHCKSCEELVKEAVSELKGVKKVEASASEGVVRVAYDDSEVSEGDIRKAIKSEGYEPI
ncbi:copper chaperone [Candidatus Woesearchaeota archaeon]|nr:MAG: copper chaperone [Candidatus Woesearchaeota archaeon]